MKRLVFLLLLCISVTLWGQSVTTSVSEWGQMVLHLDPPVVGSDHLLTGVVTHIMPCPFGGEWVVLKTGEDYVQVWLNEVHEIKIGAEIEIYCTYLGAMDYPTIIVAVFKAYRWEEE